MTVRIWVILLSGALLILISVTLGAKLSSLGQGRTEEVYRKNNPNAAASSRAGSSAGSQSSTGARRHTSATAGSYSNSMSGYTSPNPSAPNYLVPSYSGGTNRQTP